MPSTYSFNNTSDWVLGAGWGGNSGPSWNVSPGPTRGSGTPYGMVPGNVQIPANRYSGVRSIYPGLQNKTNAAFDIIGDKQAGNLTSQTENALWDIANTYGLSSGMPTSSGSNMWTNKFLGNIAGAREKLQSESLGAYNDLMRTLSGMVTDPELAAQIATWNSTMNAAPDPAAAAADMLKKYGAGMSGAMGAGGAPASAGDSWDRDYELSSPGAGTMGSPHSIPSDTWWSDFENEMYGDPYAATTATGTQQPYPAMDTRPWGEDWANLESEWNNLIGG